MKRQKAQRRLGILFTAIAVTVCDSYAGLPVDGWPQLRRDSRGTGRTTEPPLLNPFIAWTVATGAPLIGEPVSNGCRLFVVTGSSEVVAVRLGDGVVDWRTSASTAVPITGAASALAFDDSGLIVAGLPADPGMALLWSSLASLETAIESFAVDNAFYPPGPDVAGALVPTYLSAMPWNPVAMRPMLFSATPSPGDYRYQLVPPDQFALAVWWTDGLVLDGVSGCVPSGLPWPVSPERGGRPTGLDPSTGAVTFAVRDAAPAVDLAASLRTTDVVWASSEVLRRRRGGSPTFLRHGRVRVTGRDGTPGWERRTWGPLRAGIARNPNTGDLYVASARSDRANYIDQSVRTLSTGVESFVVDNAFLPPSGELASVLVPTYMRCLPLHPIEERTMVHSSTPSPGDYRYTSDPPNGTFEIAIWDELGNAMVLVRDGVVIGNATNSPPSVLSYTATGTLRWRVAVGAANDDPTPVAVRDDGVVIVGTRGGDVIALAAVDGSEIWRRPLGATLSAAPAIGPGGTVVVVSEVGAAFGLDPAGGVLWSYATGSLSTAAPTLAADGTAYLPTLGGTLFAVDAAGNERWRRDLGGVNRAGLTTSAIQSDGWLFVGRDDGVLVALAPAATAGGPPGVGNTLLLHRDVDDVVFTWTAAALSIPRACHHTVRESVSPIRQGADTVTVAVPPDPARAVGAVWAMPSILYYRVHATTCCGIDGP